MPSPRLREGTAMTYAAARTRAETRTVRPDGGVPAQ